MRNGDRLHMKLKHKASVSFEKKEMFGPNIPPKKLHGRVLNGEILVGFAKAFTNAINLGGVLTISSVWEGVTYQECCSAMHKAFEDFTSKKMQASLEATPLPIAQEALKALQAAAAQKGRRGVLPSRSGRV